MHAGQQNNKTIWNHKILVFIPPKIIHYWICIKLNNFFYWIYIWNQRFVFDEYLWNQGNLNDSSVELKLFCPVCTMAKWVQNQLLKMCFWIKKNIQIREICIYWLQNQPTIEEDSKFLHIHGEGHRSCGPWIGIPYV